MQSEDFHNGENINVSTSLAMFTIVMGLLFWEAAVGAISTLAAQGLILFGLLWYFSDHLLHWWYHHH